MKETIRKDLSRIRSLLTFTEVQEKSLKIQEKLLALPEISYNKNFLFYMAKEKEVQTRSMIKSVLASQKKVFLPSVIKEERRIIVSEINDPEKDLVLGEFGIWEPKDKTKNKLFEKSIDIVFLPGIAFDEKGGRIGHGGGYYDRLLSDLKVSLKIGLAFEEQIVSDIPQGINDIAVDKIITEKRIIDCMKKREGKIER